MFSLVVLLAGSAWTASHAQSIPVTEKPVLSHTDSIRMRAVDRPDTSLGTSRTAAGEYFRRPGAEWNGSSVAFSREAVRYYGSPSTVPLLLDEAGTGEVFLPTEAGYERESYSMTNRPSEALNAALINGVLPLTDPITGAPELQMFSPDQFATLRYGSGAAMLAHSTNAASDLIDVDLERFRAPVPYSRIHYTQLLATSFSNFEGVFSINASRATNITLAIDRRASGTGGTTTDLNFNPRVDLWGARAQLSYNSYLGTLPHDSTTTQHTIDSILATPYARAHSVDFLLWTNYTSAFSGLSGGVSSIDSTTDIFDQQLAPVVFGTSAEHRIRLDALAQLELPIIATLRTRISGYATYSSRRLTAMDTNFSPYTNALTDANRFGVAIEQPLGVQLGSFLTSAHLKLAGELTNKQPQTTYESSIRDLRLTAMASDSLGIEGNYAINLFGFFRAVEDNLTIATEAPSSILLPSLGLEASIKLSSALSLTASYSYQQERATLTPTPEATYHIRSLGAFADLRFRMAERDSFALHVGVFDRNEPEGIVPIYLVDSLEAVRFSNADLHSRSLNAGLDLFLSHFHFANQLTYYPSTVSLTPPARIAALDAPLPQRVFGSTALYYDLELGEGNLRFSLGGRLRFLNLLDPQLTYDPASDYYLYRGSLQRGTGALVDSRLVTGKGLFDILLTSEIDRRAHVSMEFLNILSTPYYSVQLYPRQGFEWRIDVTWAFLD